MYVPNIARNILKNLKGICSLVKIQIELGLLYFSLRYLATLP